MLALVVAERIKVVGDFCKGPCYVLHVGYGIRPAKQEKTEVLTIMHSMGDREPSRIVVRRGSEGPAARAVGNAAKKHRMIRHEPANSGGHGNTLAPQCSSYSIARNARSPIIPAKGRCVRGKRLRVRDTLGMEMRDALKLALKVGVVAIAVPVEF